MTSDSPPYRSVFVPLLQTCAHLLADAPQLRRKQPPAPDRSVGTTSIWAPPIRSQLRRGQSTRSLASTGRTAGPRPRVQDGTGGHRDRLEGLRHGSATLPAVALAVRLRHLVDRSGCLAVHPPTTTSQEQGATILTSNLNVMLAGPSAMPSSSCQRIRAASTSRPTAERVIVAELPDAQPSRSKCCNRNKPASTNDIPEPMGV